MQSTYKTTASTSLEKELLVLAERMSKNDVTGYFIVVNMKDQLKDLPTFVTYNAQPTEWLKLGMMIDLMILDMKQLMLDRLTLGNTDVHDDKYMDGKMN